jgi:quinol-cytochrome oxidoreductase complex cytochrome b subunit
MSVIVEIHFVLAFLAALCALVFSWTALGRRVVNAVVGLQFLMGLIVAGVLGANHEPLPPQTWLHLAIAVLVLGAYGMAIRAGRRAGGASRAMIFSIAGLVLLLLNVWIGMNVAGRV